MDLYIEVLKRARANVQMGWVKHTLAWSNKRCDTVMTNHQDADLFSTTGAIMEAVDALYSEEKEQDRYGHTGFSYRCEHRVLAAAHELGYVDTLSMKYWTRLQSIQQFNDFASRTQEQVIEVFTKAIQTMEDY